MKQTATCCIISQAKINAQCGSSVHKTSKSSPFSES